MKVTLSDKNLWKNYLAVIGIIGMLTSFTTIFVTISDKYKIYFGIVFNFLSYSLLFLNVFHTFISCLSNAHGSALLVKAKYNTLASKNDIFFLRER